LSIYPQEKLTADINAMIFKDLDIVGSLASPNAFKPSLDMMEVDKIKAEEIISHTLPLEEADKAFDLIYEERSKAIKIILKP
jgi:threonine dehydrogenase-like Zn-dependent dehydrogenase